MEVAEMAVRILEISDLIKKSEIFSTQSIDDHSFKIRVQIHQHKLFNKKVCSQNLA
jgi:hypothetical protein